MHLHVPIAVCSPPPILKLQISNINGLLFLIPFDRISRPFSSNVTGLRGFVSHKNICFALPLFGADCNQWGVMS